MQFNSLIFIFLFLPLTILFHRILKRELKNPFLLTAGLFLYAWSFREAVFIVIAIVLINYYTGVSICRHHGKNRSKIIFLFGITVNLVILVFYKYLGFLSDISGLNLRIEGLPFPGGISFITFLAVSFLTDIYREKSVFRKGFLSFSLYMAFFPRMITGPLVEYSEYAGGEHSIPDKFENFEEGVKRFVIGLSKKVIIADNVAMASDLVFSMPPEVSGLPLKWVGILAYTLRIYYDFSGYSDMAIGLGKMFGFDIPENFNYPYISESIRDFWARWHITLGKWLRNYIFLPIAYSIMRKNDKPKLLGIKIEHFAYLTGIIITFFLCGLWHGPAWTYVIWGTYYGVLLAIEHLGLRKFLKKRTPGYFRIIVTQLLVITGWVLFRSADTRYAAKYILGMFGSGTYNGSVSGIEYILNTEFLIIFIMGIAGIFPFIKFVKEHEFVAKLHGGLRQFLAYMFFVFIFVISILYIIAGTYRPFIYFKF